MHVVSNCQARFGTVRQVLRRSPRLILLGKTVLYGLYFSSLTSFTVTVPLRLLLRRFECHVTFGCYLLKHTHPDTLIMFLTNVSFFGLSTLLLGMEKHHVICLPSYCITNFKLTRVLLATGLAILRVPGEWENWRLKLNINNNLIAHVCYQTKDKAPMPTDFHCQISVSLVTGNFTNTKRRNPRCDHVLKQTTNTVFLKKNKLPYLKQISRKSIVSIERKKGPFLLP